MQNKIYSMYGTATDSEGHKHIVTIVGQYNQFKKDSIEVIENDVPYVTEYGDVNKHCSVIASKKTKWRKLTLAYAICSPEDEFNEQVGISIAKSRIKRSPIGSVESENVTMLNEDSCNMLVFAELQHIIKHIDKYITK